MCVYSFCREGGINLFGDHWGSILSQRAKISQEGQCGSGGKNTFKRSEQMKNFVKTFFVTAILHPLWAKAFKSETTSFHLFSLGIPKSKSLDIGLREVGAKRQREKV